MINLPFGNSKKVIYALILLIALFIAPFAIKSCSGATVDLMGGSAIVRGPSGVIGLSVDTPISVALAHTAFLSFSAYLIGSSTYHSQYNVNQAIIAAQVVSRLENLEIGIGVAHLQHSDTYNSGDINFALSLAYPVYKRLYVKYAHFSNSGTHSPNLGRDLLLAEWRF